MHPNECLRNKDTFLRDQTAFFMGKAFRWSQQPSTNKRNPRETYYISYELGTRESEVQPSLSSLATSICTQDSTSSMLSSESHPRSQQRIRRYSRVTPSVKRKITWSNQPGCDDTPTPELINTDFSKFTTKSGNMSLVGTQGNPAAPSALPNLEAVGGAVGRGASTGTIPKQLSANTGHQLMSNNSAMGVPRVLNRVWKFV